MLKKVEYSGSFYIFDNNNTEKYELYGFIGEDVASKSLDICISDIKKIKDIDPDCIDIEPFVGRKNRDIIDENFKSILDKTCREIFEEYNPKKEKIDIRQTVFDMDEVTVEIVLFPSGDWRFKDDYDREYHEDDSDDYKIVKIPDNIDNEEDIYEYLKIHKIQS